MVADLWNLLPSFILASSSETLLQRLDPFTRAKVLAALGGLILLGLLMMTLTYLGGRAARKYANRSPDVREPPMTRTPHQDDWADNPAFPHEHEPDE